MARANGVNHGVPGRESSQRKCALDISLTTRLIRAMVARRSGAQRAPFSVDVVAMACRDRELCVVTAPDASGRERHLSLPWAIPLTGETLDSAAARVAKRATGVPPSWIEQVGAFADETAHPENVPLSVCYVALVPSKGQDGRWHPVQHTAGLPERHRRMIGRALELVRWRVEQSPLAFSLLPREFTLPELQQTYETVLGRRLHKASFRRALQAAFLVEPIDEWRGHGRGRPAQLYR